MPRRYPAEVRHQVIELARSGTKVAQLAADQPTEIVRRDATDVLRKLKARGVFIEAQVVSEGDVEQPAPG